MAYELIPSTVWRFPSLPELWEDLEDIVPARGAINGLSISEDDKNVYVEAAVPGLDQKDVEVTFDKGILWVKGEKVEEEKKKKYYRKASSAFSYRVMVPGDIDPNKEPLAQIKNGVAKITFAKSPKSLPKKITVKAAS